MSTKMSKNTTVKSLREEAKALNIKSYSKMNKAQLIEAVSIASSSAEGNKKQQWAYFRWNTTNNFKFQKDGTLKISYGVFYPATKLSGNLAKFNGKVYTCKLKKLMGVVKGSYQARYGKDYEPTEQEIKNFLDSLVASKWLARDYVNGKEGDKVPVYMLTINMVKALKTGKKQS